jgi:anti-sigma regulatory factor (Ser/Thr protein kinase)
MATVEVTFTPLPAHVRTARLVATAVARRSGVDEALLDEVRLAVGEACSRAVEAHRRHCPAEPVKIEMTDQGERFVVVVSDHAPAGNATPHGTTTGANGHGVATLVQGADDAGIPVGFGLAVISGLAEDVHVSSTSSGVSGRLSRPRASPFIKYACRARHGHGTHCVSARRQPLHCHVVAITRRSRIC